MIEPSQRHAETPLAWQSASMCYLPFVMAHDRQRHPRR